MIIYLQAEWQKDTNLSLLVYSLEGNLSQDWAMLKPGARNAVRLEPKWLGQLLPHEQELAEK